jgi:hypothetical protein
LSAHPRPERHREVSLIIGRKSFKKTDTLGLAAKSQGTVSPNVNGQSKARPLFPRALI